MGHATAGFAINLSRDEHPSTYQFVDVNYQRLEELGAFLKGSEQGLHLLGS
jgi:hypothetical protein